MSARQIPPTWVEIAEVDRGPDGKILRTRKRYVPPDSPELRPNRPAPAPRGARTKCVPIKRRNGDILFVRPENFAEVLERLRETDSPE